MQVKAQTTLKSLLVASALMLTFGSALAAEEAVNDDAAGNTTTVAQSGDAFSQLDANKDGYIDQKEAGAAPTVAKTFQQADTDKDGKLSRDEFNAAYQKGQ